LRMTNVPACRLVADAKLTTKERDALAQAWGFTCSGTDKREPYVTYVEYRPGDRGPWLNFAPRLTMAGKTQALLEDADDPDMLRPDQKPGPYAEQEGLPVVFRAVVNGRQHLFVEKSMNSYSGGAICPQLEREEGCLIPPGRYLV